MSRPVPKHSCVVDKALNDKVRAYHMKLSNLSWKLDNATRSIRMAETFEEFCEAEKEYQQAWMVASDMGIPHD